MSISNLKFIGGVYPEIKIRRIKIKYKSSSKHWIDSLLIKIEDFRTPLRVEWKNTPKHLDSTTGFVEKYGKNTSRKLEAIWILKTN